MNDHATLNPAPPAAPQRPVEHSAHGETRRDPYYWLRDREHPDVRAYLEAENAYLDAVLRHERGAAEELYRDVLSRIQQTDEQPPVAWGPFEYYARTVEGQNYPIHCRRKKGGGEEEVLLDVNALVGPEGYARVSFLKPNADHSVIAYALDTTGGERYTLHFRDVRTGEDLADRVDDVSGYSFAWSASGSHAFYVRNDAAWRPWEVYRHELGAPADGDALVYREEDETFRLQVTTTDSGQYVLVTSDSTTTSEVRYVPAAEPLQEARVFQPRQRGVEYQLEDGGSVWFVLTNADDAVNFKLLAVPKGRADTHGTELLPHRAGVMLGGIRVFEGHVLLEGREDGLTQLWVARRSELDGGAAAWRRVTFDERVYTVMIGENREFGTGTARIVYSSLTTPTTYEDLHLGTLERTLVKRTPVLGGYDPGAYEAWREWATAPDGTRVPVSLVARRDTPRPARTFLIGYGSYGVPYDPTFQTSRLALLDRGWVIAIAHVRGGGELGRPWYEAGKLKHKQNTFTDFIACAEHLLQCGVAAPRELVISGGSAGGLLMGAVLNARPDLFRAVIAKVPFVDVMTTMLDASIPLTTLEYDEWGNPNVPEDYATMRAYSPYDNVSRQAYPHVLVTTGLNDPRVAYWEPAKWVARLRTHQQGTGKILLRTNFGAGHAGAGGRYDALREIAQEYAFLIAAVDGRLD